MRITGKVKCPYCTSPEKFRQHRSPWMKRLPGSRFYECIYCNAKYLTIMNMVSISIVQGRKMSKWAQERAKSHTLAKTVDELPS
ncbi:MAG: hypothetical protein RQ866_08345 [Bacteroidales bacterium]|nr:hypothetical protein [Bacteroidales bacterium]